MYKYIHEFAGGVNGENLNDGFKVVKKVKDSFGMKNSEAFCEKCTKKSIFSVHFSDIVKMKKWLYDNLV